MGPGKMSAASDTTQREARRMNRGHAPNADPELAEAMRNDAILIAKKKREETTAKRHISTALQRHGFLLEDVPADGNCFLAALKVTCGKEFTRLDGVHSDLRQQLVTWLRNNANEHPDLPEAQLYDCEAWDKEMNRLSNDGVFCETEMIIAATEVLKRNIIIYTCKPNGEPTGWIRFPRTVKPWPDTIWMGLHNDRHFYGSLPLSSEQVGSEQYRLRTETAEKLIYEV